MSDGVVIVGASHAGTQAAASLRECGYDGPVRLLHSETGLPYHRPPLSKAYLAGETDRDKLALRGPDYFANHGIDFVERAWAEEIDVRNRRLSFAIDGKAQAPLAYEALILATGASARPLPVPGARPGARPGAELGGVHMLRTISDSDALKAALPAAESVVVIGGGFIGLEIASTARKLGKRVTVVEALERLLARVFPPIVSEHLRLRHEEAGTTVLLNAAVEALNGDNGHNGQVREVVLAGGDKIAADLVVVGIGAIPAVGLARDAGAECPNGVLVDEMCRASIEGVYAAGDCAAAMNPYFGAVVRLESVHNAVEQGRVAAAHIAGGEPAERVAPWFWSDQVGLKLQMVGRSVGFDQHVLRGDPASDRFSVLYYEGGRLIGVDSINAPADHMAARRLLAARISPPPQDASDSGRKLKDYL